MVHLEQHAVKSRGTYLMRELQTMPTSTYAVLPRWMDIGKLINVLGDHFTGWTSLRGALQDLEVLCDPYKWYWNKKRRLVLDRIERGTIFSTLRGQEHAGR